MTLISQEQLDHTPGRLKENVTSAPSIERFPSNNHSSF